MPGKHTIPRHHGEAECVPGLRCHVTHRGPGLSQRGLADAAGEDLDSIERPAIVATGGVFERAAVFQVGRDAGRPEGVIADLGLDAGVPEEARRVLDAIDVNTHAGLCDRALIALMVFSFARIGAALAMKIEDVFVQNHRLWVRLREKGGKRHKMPCHHNLETYLHAYLDGSGISADPKGPLFRTPVNILTPFSYPPFDELTPPA
jgi:Phage integrase family